MHISFDLYPGYLRRFEQALEQRKDYKLHYDIHAMRNYEYRKEGGKRVGPFPQVRREGSLELNCQARKVRGQNRRMHLTHVRSWSTWTNQDHATKQSIEAQLDYEADPFGSPNQWRLSYRSDPILPVKSYRFQALGPMRQIGTRKGKIIEIRTEGSSNIHRYRSSKHLVCLYSLIERLQAGAVTAGPVDFLDDLSMFRPNMELTPLPGQTVEIEGTRKELHGFALVGPAILPLYFWQDSQSHVLAVLGHNVAYTLTGIQS